MISVLLKLLPFFISTAVFFILYSGNLTETLEFTLAKCAPIACLCFFILINSMSLNNEHTYSRRIFLGLFFSMIGDACLVYTNLLIFGVIAFAIAQICNLTAFGIKPLNRKLALILAIIFTTSCAIILPKIDAFILKLFVAVYLFLLFTMCWRSVSRLEMESDYKWPQFCSALGAISFVISDLILSCDSFVYKLPYSNFMVMFTYYAAQLGIALSVINSHKSKEVNKLVIRFDYLLKIFKSNSRKSK